MADRRDAAGQRQMRVDLEELALAFANGSPELSYYLDRETGLVAMVSAETRQELEDVYGDLHGDADLDVATVAAATGQRVLPDWQRDALVEADQVERGIGTRFVAVPGDEAHAAYRDMEEFITTVADARLQERLADAIEGRGAFGRFRRVLSADEGAGARWVAFRDVRLRERIVVWLAEEGIVPLP